MHCEASDLQTINHDSKIGRVTDGGLRFCLDLFVLGLLVHLGRAVCPHCDLDEAPNFVMVAGGVVGLQHGKKSIVYCVTKSPFGGHT